MNPFKELFLLDPDIIYFNHGSCGATLSTVFDTCQAWQRQLERDPADFINNQLTPLLQTARSALGADFYVGNSHKWLCNPKGAAFLYTRRDGQPLIEPLVIGRGEERKPIPESGYVHRLQCMGTKDVSAHLSVPAAIEFQAQHDWPPATNAAPACAPRA